MKPTKEIELELETLTNKNQAVRLSEEYFRDFLKSLLSSEILDRLDEPELKEQFNVTILAMAKLALNKRMHISSLIGIIGKRINNYQKAADYLETLVNQKLIYLEDSQFIVKHELPVEIWDKLRLFQNPLPLVIKPEKLVSNHDTGYYLDLSKTVVSRHPTHQDVYLENLNRMNSVPLSINQTVFANTVNSWKNTDKPVTKRNFELFCKAQKNIVSYYLNNFKDFYLTWFYDHRGRFYDTGYLIKVQGNNYQKGLLELAQKELIKA